MEPTFRDYQTRRDAAVALLTLGLFGLCGSVVLLGLSVGWANQGSPNPFKWLVDVAGGWLTYGLGPVGLAVGLPAFVFGCRFHRKALELRDRLEPGWRDQS